MLTNMSTYRELRVALDGFSVSPGSGMGSIEDSGFKEFSGFRFSVGSLSLYHNGHRKQVPAILGTFLAYTFWVSCLPDNGGPLVDSCLEAPCGVESGMALSCSTRVSE